MRFYTSPIYEVIYEALYIQTFVTVLSINPLRKHKKLDYLANHFLSLLLKDEESYK
jgi:hypothetical protein